MIVQTPPSDIDINDLDLLERVIVSSVKTFRDRITYLEDELHTHTQSFKRLRDFATSLINTTQDGTFITPAELADAARTALGAHHE